MLLISNFTFKYLFHVMYYFEPGKEVAIFAVQHHTNKAYNIYNKSRS